MIVGVIGAGQMGAGIAQVSAQAGYRTLLSDISLERAEAGKAGIAKLLARAVDKGKLAQADADDQPNPVRWNEMRRLPYASRCAWSLRQQQWLLGAHSVADKLRSILTLFAHQGPMQTALPVHTAVR